MRRDIIAQINLTSSPLRSFALPLNMSANQSNLFKSKQEYLFVFGGTNSGGLVSSYEVLDLSTGIWRAYEGDAQVLGQEPFRADFALPMPDKTILLLSKKSKLAKNFSMVDMKS